MERADMIRCWSERKSRWPITRPGQWLRWRVSKKWARWTGTPIKSEAELFWGQPMTIVFPEYVSSRIARFGYFEDDLTAMFLDVLRPGMCVYDVGSHFGFFSLLASEIVGPTGHVLAMEPTPTTFALLSENAARRDNISCHNLAAFSQSGEITFLQQDVRDSSLNYIVHDDAAVDLSGGQVTKVAAVAIDEFVHDHPEPDFLKIDAEGAEGPILEGMTELIMRSRPGISLEVGDQVNEKTGNRPCFENVEFLLDHGYEAFEYELGRPVKHDLESRYKYQNLFFRHPEWRFERQTQDAVASQATGPSPTAANIG